MEEGNQNRSAMSNSMLQRLKKASADYEVTTCQLTILHRGMPPPSNIFSGNLEWCSLSCGSVQGWQGI